MTATTVALRPSRSRNRTVTFRIEDRRPPGVFEPPAEGTDEPMIYALIPLIVLAALLVLFGILVLLGRFRGGRYLRPLLGVPLVGPAMKRASQAALERQNPELASAVRKLERANAGRDTQRAQQALARL